MNKLIYANFALFTVVLSMIACGNSHSAAQDTVVDTFKLQQIDEETQFSDSIPQGARILIESYPQAQLRYQDNKIIFPDGTAFAYDDGRKKSFDEQLDNSDIEDCFAIPYQMSGTPTYLADGGRGRCDEFYKKMYGESSANVQKKLTTINWFGTQIKVTKINNVDKQLQAVAKELAQYPELHKYLEKPQTFYWRKVRGANRQSSHSYGIALDIGVTYSNYWLWTYPRALETTQIKYINRFPEKIAQIFEKYGFIWGGRWYHFDTMHFEYRPEIINATKKQLVKRVHQI